MQLARKACRVVAVIAIAIGAAGCEFLPGNAGPPPAPGAKVCLEVPPGICDDILEGRVNNRAPVALVGYRILCSSATCTDAEGAAEASLLWADGMTETFSYQWVGGP